MLFVLTHRLIVLSYFIEYSDLYIKLNSHFALAQYNSMFCVCPRVFASPLVEYISHSGLRLGIVAPDAATFLSIIGVHVGPRVRFPVFGSSLLILV